MSTFNVYPTLALLILLCCFVQTVATDNFYRDYCYCTSREAHSASVHTIRYHNDRISLSVGWSEICWDDIDPFRVSWKNDPAYRKGGCRWHRDPDRERCRSVNDGTTVEYFEVCHNWHSSDNFFSVNDRTGYLPSGKLKHETINLDCTDTCRQHFADRGWHDLTSWCNYTSPNDWTHKLRLVGQPFVCKTVLWENIPDVLLREPWTKAFDEDYP